MTDHAGPVGVINSRIVPREVNVIVEIIPVEIYAHPLVDHLIGVYDLALDTDLREQICIALRVVLASAPALDHKGVVGALNTVLFDTVCILKGKLIVQNDRLCKVIHIVVDILEVLVSLRVEFPEHSCHLIGGVQINWYKFANMVSVPGVAASAVNKEDLGIDSDHSRKNLPQIVRCNRIFRDVDTTAMRHQTFVDGFQNSLVISDEIPVAEILQLVDHTELCSFCRKCRDREHAHDKQQAEQQCGDSFNFHIKSSIFKF